MSNLPKLKKKAAELEQKKQYDKALQVYAQILEEIAGSEQDEDVALYNRVGDLLLRQGDVGQAVDYYEKAVDLYAEGGFFNNAIALCNKILRNAPGRNSIYYKLGKISAKKGFTSDAKQNFLEYADRMQKAGKTDEAFRALKEFADLCPDQDDIRLMLAEQLSKRERKGEALEQLQTLYEKFQAEGRTAEARATVDRMKSIDPSAEPREGRGTAKQKAGDLVFLDVDYGDAGNAAAGQGAATRKAAPTPPPARPEKRRRGDIPPTPPDPMGGLPLIDTRDTPEAAPAAPATPAAPGGGFDELSPSFEAPSEAGTLDGLQTTSFGTSQDADAGGGMLDVEPTALGGELDGFTLGAPIEQETHAPEHDLALPGELPMLDMPTFGGDQLGGMSFDSSLDSGNDFGSDLGNGAGPLLLDDDSIRDFGGDAAPLADLDAPLGGAETSAEFPSLDGGSDLDIQKEDSASLGGGFDQLDGGDLPMLDMDTAPLAATPAAGHRAVAEEPGGVAPAHAAAGAGVAAPSREQVAQMLRDQVMADESNWELRRRYAEALLECGEREGGLEELEHAMIGFERAHDIDAAASVADEIIRLNPNSVRHHQKRVEYAFRASDKKRLSESYLELADALFRSGQADKAKTVYQRVLELSPDDVRAQAALSTFVDAAPAEPPKPAARPVDKGDRSGVYRRYTAPAKKESQSALPPIPPPPPAAPGSDDDFVNLGDWLKSETPAKSTRMVVEEKPPTGDEQADFADMLKRFKQGIAENVEEEDHESHYDLGVAYKEMGLLDEAIAEFQKALRGASHRVRAYEALGQCFLEKSQFQVASTILARALQEPGAGDDKLVGVLYLLGYATEAQHHYAEALGYYRRVFAVDIQFRDVADRIAALERRPK